MLWCSSSPTICPRPSTATAGQAPRLFRSTGTSSSKKEKGKNAFNRSAGSSRGGRGSPNSPEPLSEDERLQRLCTQGHFLDAFDTLARIHYPLSIHTYLCLLKACNSKKSLVHTKQIRSHIARHHISLCGGFLGDYLVGALAKCGGVEDALQLSDTLACLSAQSWTAIISAYADSGNGHDAFEILRRMQEDGAEPNSYTFVSLFRACGNVQELQYGHILHSYACCEGLLSNSFVGNTLVSMYGKCEAVPDAENVFCSLPLRDDVSWSALLSVYVHLGEEERALHLFRQMLEEGLPPNQQGLACVVQACGNLAEEQGSRHLKFALLEIGHAIHAHAHMKKSLLDAVLGTALLVMYSKCEAFEEATNIFLAFSQRDLIAWTAMVSVMVEQGEGERALLLYRVLQEEGHSPSKQTVAIALQACGIIAKREQANGKGESYKSIALEIGLGLHTDACKNGYASDTLVGSALVSMYGICRALSLAEEVFSSLSLRDVVAWNTMLKLYVEQGYGEKALRLYSQLIAEGVSPESPTFVLAVQACGILSKFLQASAITRALEKRICLEILQSLHMDACKKGYISSVIVGNTLLRLYGKYGTIAESERVFEAVSKHDIMSRTAMLSVYGERDQAWKALWLLREMLKEDSTLDEIAIVCMLQACKDMELLEVCQQLHFGIVSAGLEQLPSVAVASIDMYGHAASMEDVDAVFAALCASDVLAWTACITGYAGGRDPFTSFRAFEKLTLESLMPDEIALTSLLAACCHAGLVVQGLDYFLAMRRDYRLNPEPFHYSILVDLLGRAGDLPKVESVIERASLKGETVVWLSVLGACLSHGNLELAKRAFDHLVTSEQPKQWSAYAIMSNIHANDLQEEQIL